MQKFLNKLFSSKMLAQCLIESCADKFYYQNVMKKLGNALIYFLYTKNFEISKDLLMQIFACDDHLPSKELFYEGLKKSYGISDKNVLAQKLLDNALTNGYVCHSVNPIFKNTIFKNGLGVQVDINPILNLKNLEEKSYKNKFFKRQSNNSFYYTIPSGNAMHYACNGAPERVFGGPLKQMHKDVAFEDDLMASQILPMTKNENIKKYYEKVALNNIEILQNKNLIKTDKNILFKQYKKLINDFCYKYSYMFLIPFKTNQYILTANDKSVDGNNLTIYEYINQKANCTGVKSISNNFDEAYQTIKNITPTAIGMSDSSKMANLCTSNKLEYFNDVMIVKIPLYYSFLQQYAQKFDKGQKFVTQMSPYNTEPLATVQKIKN